ncbi:MULTISPECIES: hypothetical protein [unclassified Mesorhizobium]|uniref:hypothetical protein n=1 Tax=unclassified Mesorhizobium TaxID=325217 RepID=UPI001FDA8CC9|nr:hypothetical protein [Mesorhizobium sp. LNJC391B00]
MIIIGSIDLCPSLATSAVLGKSLHSRTAANLAHLVRIMNTYYSNLIEGHDTRPRDIERALVGISIETRTAAICSSRRPRTFACKPRSTAWLPMGSCRNRHR